MAYPLWVRLNCQSIYRPLTPLVDCTARLTAARRSGSTARRHFAAVAIFIACVTAPTGNRLMCTPLCACWERRKYKDIKWRSFTKTSPRLNTAVRSACSNYRVIPGAHYSKINQSLTDGHFWVILHANLANQSAANSA